MSTTNTIDPPAGFPSPDDDRDNGRNQNAVGSESSLRGIYSTLNPLTISASIIVLLFFASLVIVPNISPVTGPTTLERIILSIMIGAELISMLVFTASMILRRR